jgi:predicted Fe-Mo cluster-binding NifX family protein
MRIAVPVKDGKFSPHFGRSDSFDLFVIDRSGADVAAKEHRPLVPGADCHDFANCLADLGVELIIVGGIGAGALAKLEENGIEAVVGAAEAETASIVADYLGGHLELNPNGCEHENSGAQQSHCAEHQN